MECEEGLDVCGIKVKGHVERFCVSGSKESVYSGISGLWSVVECSGELDMWGVKI